MIFNIWALLLLIFVLLFCKMVVKSVTVSYAVSFFPISISRLTLARRK